MRFVMLALLLSACRIPYRVDLFHYPMTREDAPQDTTMQDIKEGLTAVDAVGTETKILIGLVIVATVVAAWILRSKIPVLKNLGNGDK
jgi:hypothetical protein